MINNPAFTNYIHIGYMDGTHGSEPRPELDETSDYQDGYLAGLQEREKCLAADPGWEPPKLLGPQGKGNLPFKKGDVVKIPKGALIHTTCHGERAAKKSYSVTLHDVYDGTPAFRGEGRHIQPPEAPKALWAGAGGYWSTTDINKVK